MATFDVVLSPNENWNFPFLARNFFINVNRIKYNSAKFLRGGGVMKSSIVKRSIVIHGHKTSVSLEDAFWNGLKNIAHAESVSLSKIVAEIDKTRQHGNLSSALRLFVLERVRVN